ncbi:MAG: bifunctional folylpolyglutamate synthase/dihydrofolate synthase [Solobacterium sp.]|nr:bifunctional folylpolyglutamate synthase/dihydrofolate synthase [Solobacterium sp.]
MRFNTVLEAEEWIMSRRNREHGFAHFQEAMEAAGNPQNTLHAIHVAGTNGKGSTTNYISDMLIACGYQVGTFTSPHLVEHRDRIKINQEWISEEKFLYYLNEWYDFVETWDLAMFEIDVLLASLYFRDEQVDWAVMEVGLGGRLDGTNTMAHPVLSVITTIGMDHMDRLGNTYAEIAYEKAGIIKENGQVLIGYLNDEAREVIRRISAERNAQLIELAPFEDQGLGRFIFDGDTYEIAMTAEYQKANASLALQACQCIGLDIHSDTVKKALYGSQWAGRFEKVQDHPAIILDGAHNEEGMRALTSSFRNLETPVVVVFSALADKQGREMAEMLVKSADRLYVTQFAMYRADTAAHLACEGSTIIEDWKEAITAAKQDVSAKGTVVICGSLYFISMVREYLLKN